MLEYTQEVYIADEYIDSYPTHAKIRLDKKLIERILKLNKATKDLKAYSIQDWDITPEFLMLNDDDELVAWDGRTDAIRLAVSDHDFEWVFCIKNTSVEGNTNSISIGELKENVMVLKAKMTALPPLAVTDELKYESSKSLVEKRLKGEI